MNNEFISVKDFLQGKKNIHFNDSTQPNKKEKTKKTLPKLYTSIESGIYKGKKLLLPSLQTTRSTKSIVKKCVFDVLRSDLRNKIFIEAFGGSACI